MIEKIMKQISEVENIYLGEKIEVGEFVKELKYSEEENKVNLVINRLGEDESINKSIQRDIIKRLKIDLQIVGVKVTYPYKLVEPKSVESEVKAELFPGTKCLAIISGKGGVGKSQVTYNLAKGLRHLGKTVGIVDADIYGYSIQKIANQYEEVEQENGKIKPVVDKFGIEIISTQHFIKENQNEAVVWRGPMLNKMLNNFFKFVSFSKNLDYLLIDMPPGTGDVMLNLPGYFQKLDALLVTTPQKDSAHVAIRSAKLAKQLNMRVIGIVENMSFFEIDNKKHFIFGKGGGEDISEELKVPVLHKMKIFSSENNDNEENLIKEIDSEYQKLSDSVIQKLNKEKNAN